VRTTVRLSTATTCLSARAVGTLGANAGLTRAEITSGVWPAR